jgi:hypothetical protein
MSEINEKLLISIYDKIYINEFNAFRSLILKHFKEFTDVDKEIIVSLLIDNNRINMLQFVFYCLNFEINTNHGWHALVSNYTKMYEWMTSEFGIDFKRKVIKLNTDFNQNNKIKL